MGNVRVLYGASDSAFNASLRSVNPDCREAMMGGCKLGEVFFYGNWGCLYEKLKIPHLPLCAHSFLQNHQLKLMTLQ